jgi:predicted AAA+ superfamily ATPase
MIHRTLLDKIIGSFEIAPICALLGPRQCGKTTLAKIYAEKFDKQDVHFFDLEDPLHLARLDNPKIAFEFLSGLIIIDEIQLRPDLFPILRVIVDNTDKHFLILGSASQQLIRQSSESLAGRINYLEMTPFSLKETDNTKTLWQRGGFPKSYLAPSEQISNSWRKSYIRTFLEKDIASFGFDIPSQVMRRFWYMIAHYHGQLFNASEIGRSIEVANKTASRYLDILAGTFMIRRLNPWFENMSKRQIKAPKIYFRDSGLLHSLLGIETMEQLYLHPKLGISWEGFAIEEVIRSLEVDNEDCYFWSTQSGAELDLLITANGKKVGFEFKFTDSPKITKSMNIALQDLKLDKLTVIVPHEVEFPLANNILVCGLERFVNRSNGNQP